MLDPPQPPPRVFTRPTRVGLELRVDGTLASLLRPDRVTAGPVWDAMAAPLLALPPGRPRQMLMLGVGGGSVARLAKALVPSVHIVGVEWDQEVLEVARRDFGLDALGMELVVADAFHFLEGDDRVFDVVVEDLFGGSLGSLHKPDWLLDRYSLLWQRVAPGGLLISNTVHENQKLTRILKHGPGTLLRIAVRYHLNHVLALGPDALRAATLRRTVRQHPILAPSLPGFSLRTLRA
ncbi:MAG TPA: methyltransferase domain-containing protein [Vicinamibacteria bacterium]|nr:methyltransferase domain-containing protein [Vicinamibacteria bacterium]